MAFTPITVPTVDPANITPLADRPQLTAAALKAKFDKGGQDVEAALETVATEINGLITELEASTAAASIGAAAVLTGDASAANVQAKLARLKQYVDDTVVAIGAGDMTKAVYDTDNDGVVNAAEEADKLATARQINGVAFDGSADITLTAAPTAHKSTHATGGADALTAADVGAVPERTYAHGATVCRDLAQYCSTTNKKIADVEIDLTKYAMFEIELSLYAYGLGGAAKVIVGGHLDGNMVLAANRASAFVTDSTIVTQVTLCTDDNATVGNRKFHLLLYFNDTAENTSVMMTVDKLVQVNSKPKPTVTITVRDDTTGLINLRTPTLRSGYSMAASGTTLDINP